MKRWIIPFVATIVLSISACNRHEPDTKVDTKSAAHKAGKAAYDLTQETKEAAKKAEKKIQEATHDVKQGWKEEQQKKKAEK